MRMNARLGLACLLLVAVPPIGALAPGAEEEAPEATAKSEPATTAAAAAGVAASAATAPTAPTAATATEAAGEPDAAAAGGEIEATFSPTERVPADASIRFPVDI